MTITITRCEKLIHYHIRYPKNREAEVAALLTGPNGARHDMGPYEHFAIPGQAVLGLVVRDGDKDTIRRIEELVKGGGK